MTVIFADDFNRANNTSSLGTPTTGGPYSVVSGTWGINGNQGYISAGGTSIVTFPAAADIEVQFTVAGLQLVNAQSVYFRYADANNSFRLNYTTNSGLSLIRRFSGTDATIWSPSASAVPVANGDVLKIVCIGQFIAIYQNGNLLIGIDYPLLTTGTACGYHATSTGHRFEDVSVDDAPNDPRDDYPDAYAYLGRDAAADDYPGAA